MGIIYFLVGLLATIIGGIVGIGGGVMIKPILDALRHYDITTISVLSSSTVLAMAIVSLTKRTKDGIKLEGKRTVAISIGAIIGGLLGKYIFQIFLQSVSNKSLVKVTQSTILIIIMLLIIMFVNNRENIRSFHIKNIGLSFLVGTLLGTKSAFLGIGGGPLNIAILTLLFSMNIKDATIHSIFIILFSQASKLTNIYFTTGFAVYDLNMLYYMIPGGVAGGYIGQVVSSKINEEHVKKVFNVILVFIIIINIYNIYVEI